jgi:site-specific DNA recombinase
MKVGYTRVSTREQDEGNALEQQTARVEKAGAVLIFSDIESGRSDKRKEFNKMLTMCKQGKVTEVICTRIDRLGRSVIGIHKAIATFEQYKIKLTVLDAPVDPSSPFGWFSINQMAGLAEFESRLLSSRIKHGLNYFREQKKASPRPPFGYCRIDEKYAPDMSLHMGKTKWAIASEIVEFFLSDGVTLRRTAKYILDNYSISWTAAGLRYWLLSPVLQGHTAYNIRGNLNKPENWEIHNNTHQPLINSSEFKSIQRKFKDNRHRYCYGNTKTQTEILPLAGQIICAGCGYRCFYKRSKHLTHRIRCKKHENLGETFCINKTSTYLPDIILAVDNALVKRHKEIEEYTINNAKAISKPEDSPELIERLQQLKALKSLPHNSIIQSAIDQTILEIQVLKQKEIVAKQIDNSLFNILSSCIGNIDYWNELPWRDKQPIYSELVDYVKVANGEVIEIKLLV